MLYNIFIIMIIITIIIYIYDLTLKVYFWGLLTYHILQETRGTRC